MRLFACLGFAGLVAACSGSSSNSNDGATGAAPSAEVPCPSVGDKACPNDTPATQSDVDVCNACHPQWSALAGCGAKNATAGCGPDGKKAEEVPASCDGPYAEYLKCVFATPQKALPAAK